MNSTKENTELLQQVAELMPILMNNRAPCRAGMVVDGYLTTRECTSAMEEHLGKEVPMEVVSDWFKENGYVLMDAGGLKLQWAWCYITTSSPFSITDNAGDSLNEAD